MSPEVAIDVVARRIIANRGEPRAAHQAMPSEDWAKIKDRHQQYRDEIRAAYAPTETELETALELLHRRGKEARQP